MIINLRTRMKDTLNYKIKAIAANIRNTREQLNYTQEYLAAKLNISQNAYSKIELGLYQNNRRKAFPDSRDIRS
jgi:DNA-binding XRE family transcriptional regulator